MAVGRKRVVPALRRLLEHTTDDLWLLMENSAGAGGTIGRSTEELARPLRRARPPPAARRLPRLLPLVGLGRRRDRPHGARRGPRGRRRPLRARPGALPARQRRAGRARLEPRPARLDRRGDARRAGSRTFLAHPAFQELPAILETPGPDGHGPDAAEVAACGAAPKGLRASRARPSGAPTSEPARLSEAVTSRLARRARPSSRAAQSGRDPREDAEARALDRELEELRVPAARSRRCAARSTTRPPPGTSAAAPGAS